MTGRWFADNDIPINVLSRLSAKTLHPLKYVSKEWHNLISDRAFIRAQQLKRTEPVSGFFFQGVFQWAEDDIDSISYIQVKQESIKVWHNVLNFLPGNVVIMSSSNGLICCRSCFPTSLLIIYVCNPLNKEWKTIQWPNLPRSSSIAIAFDPVLDPIDDFTEFKLVAVTASAAVTGKGEEEELCFIFDIYSSKTGLWSRSKECCQCNHNLTKNKGILVEGLLYWLTDGYQILMFDPQNEISCLIMVPLPATQFNTIPEMCMGESQGKLCYVITSEDGLQLWVLDDHFASQWSLKNSIPLKELERENSDVLYNISKKVGARMCKDMIAWIDPLAFKDGMLLLRVAADVYLYQFEKGRMKKLCDASTLGPKSMHSPIVAPYAMSLVPLGQS